MFIQEKRKFLLDNVGIVFENTLFVTDCHTAMIFFGHFCLIVSSEIHVFIKSTFQCHCLFFIYMSPLPPPRPEVCVGSFFWGGDHWHPQISFSKIFQRRWSSERRSLFRIAGVIWLIRLNAVKLFEIDTNFVTFKQV